MSKTDNKTSRKDFLKQITTLGAAGLISTQAPFAFSGKSPNEKVVVGVLGTHSRGIHHVRSYVELPHSEVAYIADVDDRWRAKGIKAAQDAGQQKKPKGVDDFRRILDDKSVDAVSIATPDHWHAPAAILALKAGKHVYVEKPCAHNPREGKLLVEAAQKYGKKVQMGDQRRSWPNVIKGIQKIKSGAIGRTYFARTWYRRDRPLISKGKEVPVPSYLDYELWQGPAPRTPYRNNIAPYNWHWFWNWGTGEIGNNGTHFIDLARWGLGVDYPIRVSSNGGQYASHVNWETPDIQTASFDFNEDKTVSWESRSSSGRDLDGSGVGTEIFGTEGSIFFNGHNEYTRYDNKGNKKEEAKSKINNRITLGGVSNKLDAVHFKNFLDAIRKGEKLHSPIDDANKSVLLINLGNIAFRAGRELHCDPMTGEIVGDSKATEYWGREYAPGWWVPKL